MLVALTLSACVSTAPVSPPPTTSSQLTKPAPVNCQQQGGTLTIETLPGGGQYGVCTFAGGKQCEEWALFRGVCPFGGVEVKGFATTLEWSLDGLASGEETALVVPGLTAGRHRLTLTATDGEGNKTVVETPFTVGYSALLPAIRR